jgi:hypothetical protein
LGYTASSSGLVYLTDADDATCEEVHQDLTPTPFSPVPEATVAAVQAASPQGNPYVALRAEFGALYGDQLLADLYESMERLGIIG